MDVPTEGLHCLGITLAEFFQKFVKIGKIYITIGHDYI